MELEVELRGMGQKVNAAFAFHLGVAWGFQLALLIGPWLGTWLLPPFSLRFGTTLLGPFLRPLSLVPT